MLFYFKYFNFFIDIVGAITSRKIDIFKVVLPIGISFFTFQAMSYTIDVYRENVEVQKNFFNFALYVSLFPQLVAGPIVIFKDVKDQIVYREITPEKTFFGFKRFIYGLAKKVLISNALAETVDKVFAFAPVELGGTVSWVAIILYALQIYYDFSGYSDMAIGIGRMFGFEFLENFNYPYLSTSIQSFWRRWHISLSSWFKDYVYIPLGGNRKGKLRTYFNLAIVFLLTGIWHGANWTFVIWGLWHGLFLIIERLFFGTLLKKNKQTFFNWIYAMGVVLIGWVFFRSVSLGYAFQYIGAMFSFSSGVQGFTYYIDIYSLIVLPFAIFFMGLHKIIIPQKAQAVLKNFKVVFWIEIAVLVALLVLCVLSIASGGYNPFIYFQF